MAERRKRGRLRLAARRRIGRDLGADRPRQGPRSVLLHEAGIQRRGGTGERGLLFFGDGSDDGAGLPTAPLGQRH